MHPIDPDQLLLDGRRHAEARVQVRAARRRSTVDQWAQALDVPRTVAELARLWWPETPTGKGRKAVDGRYFAAMAANKRLKMMVTAGLLEVTTRPHPTRRQMAYHARRVLTWADRGRWMVGEVA